MRRQKFKKEKTPMKVQKKDNITAEKNKKCLVILLFELPCMFSKDIGYNFLQNEIISADFREKDENKKTLTWLARNYYNISCGQKRQQWK